MISVTGLLLLLKFETLPRFFPVKYETTIKHFIPSEDRNSLFPGGYWLVNHTLKKKKLIHIDLNGDSQDDQKICFIQSEARRLKYTFDTATVINVHLSDEITYGRFVELINIMLKDKHKRYVLWENNFYIFGEAPPQPSQPGTIYPNPIYL